MLVRRVQNGDDGAFTAIVTATNGPLLALAVRMMGSAADGHDVLQESYQKAWHGMARLRDPDVALPWLGRIVRNTAKDALRARKRRRTGQTRLEVEARAAPMSAAAPEPHVPAGLLEALRSVPEKFSVPLLLRVVDGLSAAEVAALLGIPVGTVESRTARGKRALAKAWRDR